MVRTIFIKTESSHSFVSTCSTLICSACFLSISPALHFPATAVSSVPSSGSALLNLSRFRSPWTRFPAFWESYPRAQSYSRTSSPLLPALVPSYQYLLQQSDSLVRLIVFYKHSSYASFDLQSYLMFIVVHFSSQLQLWKQGFNLLVDLPVFLQVACQLLVVLDQFQFIRVLYCN